MEIPCASRQFEPPVPVLDLGGGAAAERDGPSDLLAGEGLLRPVDRPALGRSRRPDLDLDSLCRALLRGEAALSLDLDGDLVLDLDLTNDLSLANRSLRDLDLERETEGVLLRDLDIDRPLESERDLDLDLDLDLDFDLALRTPPS